MMVYVIFLCIAVPLTLMLPLLKGPSRLLICFMLIGAAVAVSAAEINTVLRLLLGLDLPDVALRVAPVTEEVLKAVPVLLFALLGSDEEQQVLPLSMAVGIGFAILENTWYLLSNLSAVTLGWAFLRGISTSLMHGICTFLVGCGTLYVRKEKALFYTGIFGLLTAAVTLHATYNLLVSTRLDLMGFCMPVAIYLIAQCVLHKKDLRALLGKPSVH